jgi:hypothetical protein
MTAARKFTLNRVCPVCEQGSSLLFLACPGCGTVVLACDEDGTLFPDPKQLKNQADYSCDPWISTIMKCPGCGAVPEFRLASAEEIQKLGFEPKDYS